MAAGFATSAWAWLFLMCASLSAGIEESAVGSRGHGLRGGRAGDRSASLSLAHSPVPEPLRPQLFFLFLVYGRIDNEEVWDRFFARAERGVDYQALVHCKSEASCLKNIRAQNLYEVIPSVKTEYCLDLVSAMNALLKAAVARGGVGSPKDKFVFVSGSTLPVKPFSDVHQRLTGDAASDFCVFPRNEWAEVEQPGRPKGIAVKHHQWITLSRKHAEKSVERASGLGDLMQRFQLNMGFRNTGCRDEFWHFATIYPSLNVTGDTATVTLQGFNGGPLDIGDSEIQGRCDTFVHWVPRASGKINNITRVAQELAGDRGTDMDPPTEKRPASFRRLSRHALTALRDSSFLFARKVEESCAFTGCGSLAEAFESLVFSTPPKAPPATAALWRGQGAWLDSRQAPVSIGSSEGSLHLMGSGRSMEARGSYCGDEIDVVFSNGYRATAVLSADGTQLMWSSGVTWFKATEIQR
mmetsp:Transcript_41024/g.87382  ORF Transcript_41024/g.87382 Transcript_41024/m.87382 type:complete len:468 (+) Transcript_41024:171-1574(+)